jgi:hypothetical protein
MEYKQLKNLNFNLDKSKAKAHEIKDILQADRKNIQFEAIHRKFLLNFLKQNGNKSDTALLNYTKGSERTGTVEELTNIYSDNVLLVCLVPVQEIVDGKLSTRLITYYRQQLLVFFTEKNIDIRAKELGLKGIRDLDGKGTHLRLNDKETINYVYKKFNLEHIPQEERNIRGQYIKVELHENNLCNVMECFTNDNLKELKKSCIFFGDIDYTQDLGVNFNKNEIIKYLISNYGFKLQKNHLYNLEETDENEQLNDKDNLLLEPTIIDNNTTVGKNCLTFITEIDGITARFKIYNKFIHSMEIRNNKLFIGSNIFNWLDNPEKQLQQTIEKAQDTGLSRAEITFYKTPPKQETINKTIKYLKSILEKTGYTTPIKEQWKIFSNAITENTLLIDNTNEYYVVANSFNSLTGRINGIYRPFNKTDRDTTLYYIIRYACYNLPLNIITMEMDYDEKVLYYTTQKIFTQRDNITFAINSRNLTPYKLENKHKGAALLNKMENYTDGDINGLVENNNIKYVIANKPFNINTKKKQNILADIFYVELDNTEVDINLIFKTRKQEKEEKEEKDFTEENKEEILRIQKVNNNTLTKFIENKTILNKKLEKEKYILEEYKKRGKYTINQLKLNTTYKISTIQKNEKIYLCFCTNEKILIKSNYSLFNYLDKIVANLQLYNNRFYGLNNLEDILEFKVTDRTIKNSFIISNIEIQNSKKDWKEINNNKKAEVELNNIKLEYLDPDYKLKQTETMETLELGSYKITAITKANTIKTNYYFKIGSNIIYRSNYYFNEILENKQNLLEHTFNIIVGPERTTEQKKKVKTVSIG